MPSEHVLTIGDRVAYRRAFLQSIFDYSHDSASRRGVIREVVLPLPSGHAIVLVAWQNGALQSVNTANLVLASRIHLEPA